MSTKHAFIQAEKATHSVQDLCRVLGLTTSGFYASQSRETSKRALADSVLTEQIHAVRAQGRAFTYGSPRVHAQLRADGVQVGQKRVARLMRTAGWAGVSPRGWKTQTTVNDPNVSQYPPNVPDRNFTPEGPDELWVTDTTYIPTREGWVYLAAILDCWSRKVVGYATSPQNDTALCLEALNAALEERSPDPGLIHHSDRGATYSADAYQVRLREAGLTPSMSRKGNCWDNAVAESFFGTVKSELQVRVWESRREAELEIFSYIEGWYNPRRIHSSAGYQSPDEFERTRRSEVVAA